MPKLVDQRTGEERELLAPVVLIGRAEYCDVCLPSPAVSREHARIRRRLTGHYIEDLGSRHGTWVNGVRVRGRAKLYDGDVIAVAVAEAEGHATTSLHVQHTDTDELSRQPPAPGQDAGGDRSDAAQGGSFVFRK